ncbi:hypothetical protein [Sulfuricella sp.]|uniref:hypothetical protein n=1 Tax=Sulfuricella sp. TaxID=2099377 RepID=UPI002D1049F6|nr:hypothetical protein [Sulfuricella sp.]HUX64607.1 hypothetical protein [Sulfuricella sp.]
MNGVLKKLVLATLALGLSMGAALADDLKPFVLASKGAGTVADKAAAAKTALQANGFTIAGSYSPYPETTIIVVTNDEMKTTAAKSENGGFGAAQRVSVTKVHDEVQVSYTNPTYMANGYRMAGDLPQTSEKLKAALGKVEEFGAKGLSASKLRKYHYMFGMEYFDEPVILAEYGSHEEAVKAVEANLAAGKGGCTKVYRVDVPGKKESVFGVAMKGGDKYMDDKYIMSIVDFGDLKASAHLPHEMLVTGNQVIALYGRFRIALDFPDLKMSGANSFMKIMESPEAIRKAMVAAAGGKE